MKEQEPHPFERIPEELTALRQWVNWKLEDDKKVPVNPFTMGNAGVHWDNTWASFDTAQAAANRNQLGLGFVLTEDDLYTVIDLDDCVGEGRVVSSKTREILDLLTGWVELSPSEAGLHIWVQNEQPVNQRTQGIEVYSSSRWMTVTGQSNPSAALGIPERTAEVAELVSVYFPQETSEFVVPTHLPEDEEI